MKNIQYYAFPSNLKELSSMLFKKKGNSIVVAGWTLMSKTLPDGVETVIDLKNLPLRYIKITNKNLVIGALSTFDDIDNSPVAQKWASGVLSDVASKCSSQLIRNMATIGGNLAKLHSFNLFPGVLLALDAKVRVLTKTQIKTFEISDIYRNDFSPRGGSAKQFGGKCSFGRDSIIIEIIVPSKTKNWKCIFEKVAKTYSSWESYANITCAVEIKNKEILNFRFVVGALLPKPVRFEPIENIICGNKPGYPVTSSKDQTSGTPHCGFPYPTGVLMVEESIKCLKEELEKIHLAGKISDYKKEVVLSVFRRLVQTKLK